MVLDLKEKRRNRRIMEILQVQLNFYEKSYGGHLDVKT